MKYVTAVFVCLFLSASLAQARELTLTELEIQHSVAYYENFPITVKFDADFTSRDDYEIISLCINVVNENTKCHLQPSIKWNANLMKVKGNWTSGGKKSVSVYVKYRYGSWKVKTSNILIKEVRFID
ncbi:MAG: hypothetical protein ACI84R_000652 [Candidatus Azotimanducaceae bacterium]|jgi:hypothetical protein